MFIFLPLIYLQCAYFIILFGNFVFIYNFHALSLLFSASLKMIFPAILHSFFFSLLFSISVLFPVLDVCLCKLFAFMRHIEFGYNDNSMLQWFDYKRLQRFTHLNAFFISASLFRLQFSTTFRFHTLSLSLSHSLCATLRCLFLIPLSR